MENAENTETTEITETEIDDLACPGCGRLLINKYNHHVCPGGGDDGCIINILEEEREINELVRDEDLNYETEPENCGDEEMLELLDSLQQTHKQNRELEF